MVLRQNLICTALICFGILLPDLYLGYFLKMLSCTVPLAALASVMGLSAILTMVKSRGFLVVIVVIITITQGIQLNHWAYFGAPIHSQDITKAFAEFDEIFEAGSSLANTLWPVWLAQALSLALLIYGTMRIKKCRHFPFMWILVLSVLAINPVLSYIRGPQFFHNKPTASTIHNTLRSFSDWLVNSQTSVHNFGYKAYEITYGQPKIKNVVLIMGESQSSRYMQMYGYKQANTPFLEELKGDRNFAYTKGISTSLATIEALQLFFNNFHNPGFIDLIRNKSANLFRLARHQGYKTFLISAQGEGLFHETGTQYMDYFSFKKDMLKPLKEKGDEALLDVLVEMKFSDKNFIVIHLRHIHEPFGEYAKYHPELAKSISKDSRENQAQQEYSNAIAYHDNWVKQCVTCIRKILPNDTIIIFTSDHGQLVGERGLFGHNLMQPEVVDVPVWAYAINADLCLNNYLKSQTVCSHYDLGKQIANLFGAHIHNPNEHPNLQYVHGTELHKNYPVMPWKKTKKGAEFLKIELANGRIDDKSH